MLLKKEFAECKLEDMESDPEVWVRELEHLRLRIRGVNADNALTDKDMMVHILANLPAEYSELITTVESELDCDGGEEFGLDDLMTRLQGFYKRKFEMKAREKDDVALAVAQFKGLCRSCGQYSHKAADCPEKKRNATVGGKKKFNGKCFYCGKLGHRQEDCFKRMADEHKKDQADLVLSCVEEQETGMSETEDLALRMAVESRKDFFICDSGATAHMTHNKSRLHEVKPASRSV